MKKTTDVDGYPTVCVYAEFCLHGGKIVKTGDLPLWFYTNREKGVKWAAHCECVKTHGFPGAAHTVVETPATSDEECSSVEVIEI